jgi:hypothetical protein
MTEKLTLSWVDKLRELRSKGYSYRLIFSAMMRYGESEEERIEKAFEEKLKEETK